MFKSVDTALLRSKLGRTVSLGLPLIFTQLLGYMPQVVDTVMAGWHSPLTQASVGLASQVYALVFLLMIGVTIAISATVSSYHGDDNAKGIRRSFQQGLWMSGMLGVVTFILTIISAYIPGWIGSAPDIAHEAKMYLLTLAPGAAVFVFALGGRYFLEGMAWPRSNIIIQVALIPVNILGNYAFLTGWWIFPQLGAQGMAIATNVASFLYAILLFAGIYRNPRWRRYRLFTHFGAPDWVDLRLFLRLGIPISLAIVMEAGLFNVIGMIVSRTNETLTAANQIAINFSAMVFMLPLGLSSAMTILAANERGRKDWRGVRYVSFIGLGLSVLLMLVTATVIAVFSRQIAEVYSDVPEIIEIASTILLFAAVFQIGDGIQVVAAGVMRGLNDSKMAMIYALIGYWMLGFPSALILAYVFDYGIYGLWSGLVIGLSVNAILGARRVWQLAHLDRSVPQA
ncbi:MATE family efflux transporter [Cardiobacteriaceae bacterium TAE3-ERU3]|nr:MATE family efflux transporter [Cardiobacteriaceae bacterium TAE3-ERU3]